MSDGSLRLGAIGCGQVFQRLHLPAIGRSRDVRLISVCETDGGRRSWLREVVPDATAFGETETLLAESALDAVLVCTPPQTHADIVLAALKRGLHVLAEKPLAMSAVDGRAIVEAARDNDRQVVVGFNRRFRRTYQALRSRLAEGEPELDGLRFIFQADADRWNRSPAAGPAAAVEPSPAGILSDVASHQLDLVQWLTGRIIEEVRARPGSEQIGRHAVTIRVRLDGGVEAELHAGYGSGYSECLEVERADRRLVAYPAALIDPKRIGATLFGARRVPGGLERGMARATEAGSLLVRRSTGRPSLTVESVERQLACFAGRVQATSASALESAATASGSTRWLADGADERDGMWCAAAVDACQRSLDTDGDWQPLER